MRARLFVLMRKTDPDAVAVPRTEPCLDRKYPRAIEIPLGGNNLSRARRQLNRAGQRERLAAANVGTHASIDLQRDYRLKTFAL